MDSKSELPMALRATYLALHRQTNERLASLGVTADQFVLLATLSHGVALSQRDLARRMPSDPSTVRAMLVLLERSGLVRREEHPTDARARTAALTAAGKRTYRQLWTAGESIRTQMVESLEIDEVETLVGLLSRVAESLNSESVSVGGTGPSHSQEDEA